MKRRSVSIIFLAIILIFAAAIYVYKLDIIPNGFYVDEATVAYNAYSVLETGKDAFGQSYPILFRLLGSYTPPLYIYLSALFIKFFGMAITTFRIISSAAAIVSVLFFYLFIKKLKLFKSDFSNLAITFFYSITPWLVFNARLGYEVTLAYLLFNIGLYFLLVSFEKPNNLVLGIIFLSLSTYAAHTQRFLAPIFVLFYFIIFRKTIFIKNNLKSVYIAAAAAFIIHIPHLTVITTPAFWVKNQRLFEGGNQMVKNIFNQAASYLSTQNLFYCLGDIDQQHIIPDISVMYKWMVVPFFVGLFTLFLRVRERNYRFLLLLFIASLIPAILSGEFISIQRALPLLLPLSVVVGIGIDDIGRHINRYINAFLFIVISVYSLLMLYRSYFILFPVEQAYAWNYGYQQLAEYISKNEDKHFMVDNTRNPRNYILLLYYLNYPPGIYQEEVDVKYKTDYYRSLPTENSYKFSNVEVREIDWEKDSYTNQIIVGDSLSVSQSQASEHFLDKVYEVFDPENNPILIFYQTNPEKKCDASWEKVLCNKYI